MKADLPQSRQMKLNGKMVVVFVGFLVFQQIVAPHKVWGILMVGMGGALLLGFLWARSLMKGIHFEREIRSHLAKVGDQLQERFVISNQGRFPAIWVSLVDHSDFPRYQVNTARFVRGKSVRRWLKGSVCFTRGFYTLGPTELETGDPFGFFQVKIKYDKTQTMLVVPPIIPLPSIEIASGDRIGEGGTRVTTPKRTVTTSGVREYAPGDSLFSVHWLTSARLDDLYVRVFDRMPTSDWWVFVDMDQAVQLGEGEEATEEYSIILAASIADRGLRNGRAVGLVSHGDRKIWLPPQTGSGQRWEILRSLATVDRGDSSMFTMLAETQRFLGRSTSAIIITPSVNLEWLRAIMSLMQRDIRVTVLLLDPSAFGGEGSPLPVLGKLSAWGINHYRISPEIYKRPVVRDYFVWQKSSHGTSSSSSFTASDLDWSKL
ncbi:MAG TPA: DUF58 domain-containing protein [Anaerolineales bacterium]|jgi:uncharacterized protein (DUF58 family)|nr:DUF58 domain-containing protein [Anaerolineales bacterium]